MKTMYDSPEEHAKNGPETWTVRTGLSTFGSSKGFVIADAGDNELAWFRLKRDAVVAMREGGTVYAQWHRENDWYNGGSLPGQPLYAELVKREEQKAHRERRSFEKFSLSLLTYQEWQRKLAGVNPADVAEAAQEMLDFITGLAQHDAMMTNELTLEEAAATHAELTEAFELHSPVHDYLHDFKYRGINEDKSALEVLEELDAIERERGRYIDGQLL